MRGTLTPQRRQRRAFGIIPAYAGNTRFQPFRQGFWRDHPRVCGEHIVDAIVEALKNGIIPAYAGNT